MERTEDAEGAAWLLREEFARKKHKRERQRKGEVNEDGGETRIRSQSAQEVVGCIKEKVSVHDGIKEAVQRKAVQSFMRSCDCSQIENEVEEGSWREGDQMAAQWEQLEGTVERRRIEGSSLQLDVMQKGT